MEKFISYRRVSTQKQGKSGLGLEAQDRAVHAYCAGKGQVIAAYKEIESGKATDRPELLKAIARAKRSGATLVFAKLDRLARNAGFLLMLRDELTRAGVRMVFCDYPNANELTIGLMAVVSQDEARAISQRTKDGLAEAKAKGTLLGSSRPGHWDGREHLRLAGLAKARERSLAVRREQTKRAYVDVIEVVVELRESGKTLRAIAAQLNAEGFVTRRGSQWRAKTVSRVLAMA